MFGQDALITVQSFYREFSIFNLKFSMKISNFKFQILNSLLIAILFLFLVNPQSINAANEFSTSYDIQYSVSEDGNTQVTENIKLKNLTDKFFPSSFSVTLPGTDVSEITATDKQGQLEVQTNQDSGNTKVTINFSNTQIIGLNKEYAWTLTFKDRSIARNLGKVWNINIPKISQQTQVDALELTLSVPTSFSDPDFISPKPAQTSESGGRINLIFTQNELLSSGISAIFGNTLGFEFETSYILNNNGIFPKYVNIVIPQTSAYQKSYLTSLEPRPENTAKDEFGNYLAVYKINAGQEYEVKARGFLQTFLKSQHKDVLSEDERKVFTSETKFWDKNNPNIKTKLSEILLNQNPENNLEKARLIDKYVSNFLKFDQTRIEKNDFVRFGSVTALNNPEKALSAEFVDLETALLRAEGIPTRQVIGFALKGVGSMKPFSYSNQNLHSWLEVYDPNYGWVISDPAWENTTAGADFFAFNDLNHLSLAFTNSQEDFILPTSIDVKIYDGELKEEKGAELDVSVKEEILSGFPSKGRITIRNLGNTTFPASNLQIDTSKILLEFAGEQPISTKLINTPEIPPFGNLEYEFNLKTGAIWHSYQDAFQVKFAGVDDTRIITVVPILSQKIFAIEIFGAITIIALFYAVILLVHHKSYRK